MHDKKSAKFAGVNDQRSIEAASDKAEVGVVERTWKGRQKTPHARPSQAKRDAPVRIEE